MGINKMNGDLGCEKDTRRFSSNTDQIKSLNVVRIDYVNFVYNKCDLVHYLASLAGKTLHWS